MGKERTEKRQRRITAQSFVNLEDRLAFARNLVDSVENLDKAQEVFSFFCHFVAFNILYEFHMPRGATHWEAVKTFLEREYANMPEVIHPGGDSRFPLLNGAVLNGRQEIVTGYEKEKDYIENEIDPDIKVFLRILQIRNNLFHGSKELNDRRDMPLIWEANVVLKLFLQEYFERKGTPVQHVECRGEI